MASPAEFERCLRRPAFYRDGAFALHLCARELPVDLRVEPPEWRLGLVIPKRYEASAVARNTIKRRWRDAFRRGRVAWASEFGSADLVVRLQSPLVPKPAKPQKSSKPKSMKSESQKPAAVIRMPAAAPLPAKARARQRFDPPALFDVMVERLRARGSRPVPRSGPVDRA